MKTSDRKLPLIFNSICLNINPSLITTTTNNTLITTKQRLNVLTSALVGAKLRLSCMAGNEDLSVHGSEIRKKKISGQQKREDLEREVSMLHKMLNHEENVHNILQHAQNHQKGTTIHIPKFLPAKTKELLAELAMVEGEIARLEGQISQLQSGLNREREVTREMKSRQWQYGTVSKPRANSSSPLNLSPRNLGILEKKSFETKALHFISKAIKGDLLLHDFSSSEKTGNSRELSDHKENHFLDVGIQEKVPKRSGIQKPPSPVRRPLQANATTQREPDPEMAEGRGQKPLPTSIQTEENSQTSQPNKLSENLMKCLIFIYMRLIRTSRTMEIEKSGPITRSTHSSLSFRADSGLTSLLLQKDSRQQDPYGIFDIEDSIPRDIGPYKNLVRFSSTSLDPKCISNSSSIPLFQKLRVFINDLQKVDLRFLTYQQKLAFWINIYNACVMHGFVHFGVPSSPEKLVTLLNKATLNIGGNTITARVIEKYILRKPTFSSLNEVYRKDGKDNKEFLHNLYGLASPNPNITFAISCGTQSSPAVRIYTAEGVMAELEKSKSEYLQASVVVTTTKRIQVPELLLRNMVDFAKDANSLIEWICLHLPASGSLRKSIVDCYRSQTTGRIVDKIPYDYEFGYLLVV